MTEVAPEPGHGTDLKVPLLFAVRDNKPKEAIRLLKEGAEVDYKDQTGCFPLHYAAQKGYIDVVDLLLEKGAETFAWDKNGQTALHKAAMQGHVNAIISLVARGARVDIIDRTGRLALEYAVRSKHVAAVKLLCQFGSEPLLLDWTWLQDDDLKKKSDLFEIAKVLKRQLMRISGYKHGYVHFRL
ncbi:26S proteasome non-ATPase regulatory subunit 10-like [Pecten maximus]|uniref:26S proteasome non-ATPase regulatory subunit 10-like n=1 Tax=Pecten maximus TaxID=6579 RepID=UPI0014583E31|nr:26S proteasome non-ATPase regulatory subunit 10-like [Pecten maximus]